MGYLIPGKTYAGTRTPTPGHDRQCSSPTPLRREPAPEITVAGFKNGAKVSRKSLTSGVTVTARAQEGFEFKIPKGSIRVMSLEVFVGNKPFNYNGNAFEPDGLSAIRNANRGDNIYVTAKVMMPDGVPQNANCVLTITK